MSKLFKGILAVSALILAIYIYNAYKKDCEEQRIAHEAVVKSSAEYAAGMKIEPIVQMAVQEQPSQRLHFKIGDFFESDKCAAGCFEISSQCVLENCSYKKGDTVVLDVIPLGRVTYKVDGKDYEKTAYRIK